MSTVELPLSRIPLNQPVSVASECGPLVVIRGSNGVFAYQDRCPHAFWPLSGGEICQGVLECPGHGWEFDIETGQCLNAPAYCLNAVDVAIEGETVRLLPRADRMLSPAGTASACPANEKQSTNECLR